MTKKRSLFTELMEGVDAMRRHREGKITLRSYEVGERPPLTVDAGLIRETRQRLNVSRAVFARGLRVSTRTFKLSCNCAGVRSFASRFAFSLQERPHAGQISLADSAYSQ